MLLDTSISNAVKICDIFSRIEGFGGAGSNLQVIMSLVLLFDYLLPVG